MGGGGAAQGAAHSWSREDMTTRDKVRAQIQETGSNFRSLEATSTLNLTLVSTLTQFKAALIDLLEQRVTDYNIMCGK